MADLPLWLQYTVAVSQALGGLGLFGAVLAYALQSRAIRRRRARERDGLLILLEDEIARNRMQLKAMREHPHWITAAPQPYLRTQVWSDVRARLSDLLENEEQFIDFATYYGDLLVVDEVRLNEEQSVPERREDVSRWLPRLLALTEILDQHIWKYVPGAGEGTALKSLGTSRTPGHGERRDFGA